MKKILIALAAVAIVNSSADAQTKSKFDKNYPVCRTQTGYDVCGIKNTPENNSATVQPKRNNHDLDEYVSVGQDIRMEKTYSYSGYMRRHNIVVSDEMDNPYQGKPSAQYDGPVKNEYRNMNVNQTSIQLPSSDGK